MARRIQRTRCRGKHRGHWPDTCYCWSEGRRGRGSLEWLGAPPLRTGYGGCHSFRGFGWRIGSIKELQMHCALVEYSNLDEIAQGLQVHQKYNIILH